MKPFRTFIFFAAVVLLISLLALVVPDQGIGIGGDLKLSFLSFSELTQKDTLAQGEAAERLMAGAQLTDDPESDQGTDLYLLADEESETSDPQVNPVNADSLKQQIHRILFSERGKALLHAYFERLDRISSGRTRQTRILHFGDSQIENNRMTTIVDCPTTGHRQFVGFRSD